MTPAVAGRNPAGGSLSLDDDEPVWRTWASLDFSSTLVDMITQFGNLEEGASGGPFAPAARDVDRRGGERRLKLTKRKQIRVKGL